MPRTQTISLIQARRLAWWLQEVAAHGAIVNRCPRHRVTSVLRWPQLPRSALVGLEVDVEQDDGVEAMATARPGMSTCNPVFATPEWAPRLRPVCSNIL